MCPKYASVLAKHDKLLLGVESAPMSMHLNPIEGETFSKMSTEKRSTKGESIGISMPTGKVNSDAVVTYDDTADTANAISVAASRAYNVATANEPLRTTLLIAMLADDDPTIINNCCCKQLQQSRHDQRSSCTFLGPNNDEQAPRRQRPHYRCR